MLDNLNDLLPYLSDENRARELFEKYRWPKGVICPHCGNRDKIYEVKSKKAREGVYKCGKCRKQFSATVGTVFHGSRIPLSKWLYAIYMMCSSKKGVSAKQLERTLGITYRSAWFMCHRVRYAMSEEPLLGQLKGVVEIDETYIGGKARNNPHKKRKRGRGTTKPAVMALIQRDGKAKTFPIPNTTRSTLHGIARLVVDKDAEIVTDQLPSYRGLDRHFKSHQSVNHSQEYVRGTIHTNFAESYFSLLKRGIFGTFHHVSRQHLPRYLREFEFRWNNRKDSDLDRVSKAIFGANHKRLTLKAPVKKAG